MIDDYLLEALVAFAKYGTLSATAEHLMSLSQRSHEACKNSKTNSE